MPTLLPVPWYQWRRFRVEGVVLEQESQRPLEGLLVRAFDKDVFRDDHLGDALTDAAGRFEIRFTDEQFKDVTESRPDIYLCVVDPETAQPILDTTSEIRQDASREEHFEIAIPQERLHTT